MRRRTILLTTVVLFLLVAVGATGLVLLVGQEPAGWRDRAVPEGEARRQQSKTFFSKFAALLNVLHNGDNPTWQASFSEVQINSYFEEDFLKAHGGDKLLPDGITEPRVALEQDTIHLYFRYGSPPWSTIISIDLRAWQAQAEPNVVALELQGLHAGSLPISAQSLLEQISEVARKRNIEVTWYRHNSHPVALLRFPSDKPQPTVQLKQLRITDGIITVAGICKPPPSVDTSVTGHSPQAN